MAFTALHSHKAFKMAGFNHADDIQAMINILNPALYEAGATDLIVIVDGHAWDLASIDAVAEQLDSADTDVTDNDVTTTEVTTLLGLTAS